MSGLIFPAGLLGEKFTQRKAPKFNTAVQSALSGKTTRIALQPYPLYEWELAYELLRDDLPRVNWIPWSQDFTQWTPTFTGVGAIAPVVVGNWRGTPAPDGTYTAGRTVFNIGPSSAYSEIYQVVQSALITGATYTFSVWMRTNDGSTKTVALLVVSNANGLQYSSLALVTPVWTRFVCTGVWSAGAFSTALAYIGLNTNPVTSSSADISCWGAQFEPGSLASPNIMTNGAGLRVSDFKTVIALFNQMSGQADTFLYQDPDFNAVTLYKFAQGSGTQTAFNLTAAYTPGAEVAQYGSDVANNTPVLGFAGTPEYVQNTIGPPSIYTGRYGGAELLSTGSRTNIALQSNFGAGAWTASGTLTTNASAAPDGTTTAAKLTEGSTTSQWYTLQSIGGVTGGARYNFSIWLKSLGRQFAGLVIDTSTTDAVYFAFDIGNGLVAPVGLLGTAFASNADASITYFGNGWFRCSVSGQLASADTSIRIGVCPLNSFVSARYPTIPGINADSFFMWGAQFESGTQPTALLPTTTVAVTGGSDYSLTNLTTAGTAVYTFQQVQFAVAPANNVPLLWTGSFFYRCRFMEDLIEFKEFLNRWWSINKLAMEQVIL